MRIRSFGVAILAIAGLIGCAKNKSSAHTRAGDVAIHSPPKGSASIDEVLTSGVDLWGEGALTQPGGPSYEYFAKLRPPLR